MSLPAESKPLAVLDTGILFAGTFSPNGVSGKVLDLVNAEEIAVVMSDRLRSEYEETLTDERNRQRFPHITIEDVWATLDLMDDCADRVTNPPRQMVYERDPNDELLINLVLATKAAYLVTLDQDLLALPLHPEFIRQPHQPRVLRPGAFLTEIERLRDLRTGPEPA